MYYFATIDPDLDAENPRYAADTIGTLYTWHPKYLFGGPNDFNQQNLVTHFPAWVFLHFKEFAQLPELKDYTCKEKEIYVNDDYSTIGEIQTFNRTLTSWLKENLRILPVYLSRSPAVSLSTETTFYHPNHIGFIYVTKTKCESENLIFADAASYLKNEIEVLNYYMDGDVWTFTIYSTHDKEFENRIISHTEKLPQYFQYQSSCEGCYNYERTKTAVQHLLNSYHQ